MPTTKTKTTRKSVKKAVKKSPAKKQNTKKVTAKKVVSKKTLKNKADKEVVHVPDDISFWVNDGQILNSLHSLNVALEKMHKDAYAYHVSKENNDFANWVEDALCDGDCAKDLRKAKTPKAARTVVVRHLKLYKI